jgi:hypothetical protein
MTIEGRKGWNSLAVMFPDAIYAVGYVGYAIVYFAGKRAAVVFLTDMLVL